jgi:hypothetical protein
VGVAELAHDFVDLLWLVEIADMTGAGDYDQLRVWDCLLELPCDAER